MIDSDGQITCCMAEHKGDRIMHILEHNAQHKSAAIDWNPVIEYKRTL